MRTYLKISVIAMSFFMAACGGKTGAKKDKDKPVEPKIKEEAVQYVADSVASVGYVAYNENAKEKMPVVLIVPEWWGVNDYVKNRAKQLAELGYLAFVVDMYGGGKLAEDPEQAMAASGPFYADPQMAKRRLDGAFEKAKTYALADASKIVAIGYCFGGSMVLNAAKLGAPFVGVVSFHGGLQGVPPQKGVTKADVLVCHGRADNFVPEKDVNNFKHQMDSVGASYTFKQYPEATHAFTNPEATGKGEKFNLPIKYNEKADKESWKDMMDFFKKILS